MTEATSHGPAEVARLFVASAPIFMTLLDLNGQILEISPVFVKAFVESTGASRDQLIGLSATDAVPDAAGALQDLRERLARGAPLVELERTLVADDGRTLHLRCQGSYWRDEAGRPIAI